MLKIELLGSPRLWLTGFITWAAALFVLSSFSKTMPEGGPEIPHIDKILHFGYFMGGAFTFATWVILRKGLQAPLRQRILLPLLLFAVIGALDEWHQTFTPGRSGNDPFDWLADILGSLIKHCPREPTAFPAAETSGAAMKPMA
ncbi:VanZ family protein [Akkermansiaceae bacterium]|nr:VanZ family protein [Akkermansiaceae bacterium]